MQDSEDDWRHEGCKMAEIYVSYYFTVAAPRATDSSEVCFATSLPDHISREITVSSAATEPFEIQTRIELPHGLVVEYRMPLLQRGWAFQERTLSPRTLRFTEQELGWECSSRVSCECSSHAEHFFENHDEVERIRLVDLPSPPIWHGQLQRIVTEYSGKELTFSKYIFPALQVVAKKNSPILGAYLAGLWDKTLIYSLTWCLESGHPASRLTVWRAPTWSWASIYGKVVFSEPLDKYPRRTFAAVVSATTTPKGEDPAGELLFAMLRLRGRWLNETFYWPCSARASMQSFCISLSNRPSQSDFAPFILVSPNYWDAYLDYRVTEDGPHHIPDSSQVLPMKVDENLGGVRGWLVLMKTNAERKVYERIGVMKVVRDTTKARVMDQLYEEFAEEMEVDIV